MKYLHLGVGIWLLVSSSAALAADATSYAASPITPETQAANSMPVTIAVEGVCPDDGHMYEGGGYAIQLEALIDTGNFLLLNLLEIHRDGLSASPANSPSVRGLDGLTPPWSQSLIMYWIPAAGEAGVWAFCFEAQNDLGAADTTCAVIEVAAPDPDHLAWEPGQFRYHEGTGSFDVELRLSSYHSTDTVAGIIYLFALRERAGSAFLAAPLDASDFVFPPEYAGFNGGGGPNTLNSDAVSPDTLIVYWFALGAYPLLSGGPYTIIIPATLRAEPGIMAIDSIVYNGYVIEFYWDGSIHPTYSPGCFAVSAGPPCTIALTGDANNDGALAAADIIWLVNYVFKSGAPPEPCVSAGDVNCNAVINAADLIYLVTHVFKSGAAPCDVCTLDPDIWMCP